MAKPYNLSEREIPSRQANILYADVVADFVAQGAESMQVTIEGVKPATLRPGLRAALKNREGQDVKLVQRGEATYLVKGPQNAEG
jgi:hypothetical protein